MISIVVAGRNDDYGGDFRGRLLATTRHNVEALESRRVAHELVFVEWNPLSNRPLLSSEVSAQFPSARCWVVDPLVHRWISCNRRIQLFEYHAKNVGLRRARGEWVLVTNPDNYFGADVLDFLEAADFDDGELCRAGRVDVGDESEVDSPNAEDEFAADPPPYLCASGDFVFAAKSLIDAIGGYREDLAFTNTHKDSILCLAALEYLDRVRKVGNTFHLRHQRDDHDRRRLEYDLFAAERAPQPDYGMPRAFETTIAPNVTWLSLPFWGRIAARFRRPPEGLVPAQLAPRVS